MKIVKSLEESGLSSEGVSEAIENKLKVQNFGIQKYYQNTRFNGVDSINNLPKIKDNKSWWLQTSRNPLDNFLCNVTYFDKLEVEKIPKETKKCIGNRHITTNTYRI